jgi:hypothetical protein
MNIKRMDVKSCWAVCTLVLSNSKDHSPCVQVQKSKSNSMHTLIGDTSL